MEGVSARPAVGVVFDLDGTLIETAPDLHRAAVDTLAAMDRPPLSLETIRSFVGHGVSRLVARMIAASDLDPGDQENCERIFLDTYNADPARFSTPFAGVTNVLDALARFPLGVCTNKPAYATGKILSELTLEERFDAIVCGDTAPRRKPDPSGLLRARDMLGVAQVIFVGDSETDGETARRAGVPFLLFTGGYRAGPVNAIPHTASFDHFDELPALVNGSASKIVP